MTPQKRDIFLNLLQSKLYLKWNKIYFHLEKTSNVRYISNYGGERKRRWSHLRIFARYSFIRFNVASFFCPCKNKSDASNWASFMRTRPRGWWDFAQWRYFLLIHRSRSKLETAQSRVIMNFLPRLLMFVDVFTSLENSSKSSIINTN